MHSDKRRVTIGKSLKMSDPIDSLGGGRKFLFNAMTVIFILSGKLGIPYKNLFGTVLPCD